MNWVDIVIIVVMTLAAFSSLNAGFLRQAFALIGFVVGLYAALTYHEALARALLPTIGNATVATVVGFSLILVMVWVASALLAAIGRGALKALGLAWTDNLLGLLLGLAAGLFFTVCFLLLFSRIPAFGIRDAVLNSLLASYIFRVLPSLRQLLPTDLRIFTVI